MRSTRPLLFLMLAAFAGCESAPHDPPYRQIPADGETERLPGIQDEPSLSFRPMQRLEDVVGVPVPLPILLELEWHDYDVVLVSGRAVPPWELENKDYDTSDVDGVVIRKSGSIVYSRIEQDASIELGGWGGVPGNAITDLDANGRPELILVQHSLGNHSHLWFTFCELEPEFRVAATLDGPADMTRFEQLDGSPALEFITADRTFDAWTCQADQVHIPIPLRCADGAWRVAVDLMRRAPSRLSCPEIEACERASRNQDPSVAKAGMRYVLLDAIAAGREQEGWDAVKAWAAVPDDEKGRFVARMRRCLEQSPLWSNVRAAYRAGR